MFVLEVKKNDAGQRLDKFLMKCMPTCPASLIYKSIRIKKIKVDRKRCTPEQILVENQTVQLFLSDDFFVKENEETFRQIKNPMLDVRYEDENLLICDKAPGMPCHSDKNENFNTLIDNIKAYLFIKGEYKPEDENSFSPALCNRIDRNTGGLVISAKNADTLRYINDKIKKREIEKKYLLAVHGIFPENSKTGTLKDFLVKDKDNNTVTVVDKNFPGAKTAITHYKVLAEQNGLSLVEAKLETGRTHQIRVQFASAGYPLLGEGKYGINREDRRRGYNHQALYSYYLKIDNIEVYAEKNKIAFLKEFPDFEFKELITY